MADLSGTANDTSVGGQFYMMWHLAGDGNMWWNNRRPRYK